MLTLMLVAVACGPEESQPTAAPPTATAAAPSPTPTAAPTATPEPTPTPAPTATPTDTPTAAPTATPTPSPEPTATPTPVPALSSVQEVLDAAAAAMASIESGVVSIEAESKLDGPFVSETRFIIQGDFLAPDRSRFTLTVTAGSSPGEHNYIVIGEEGYYESPFSGAWESSSDPLRLLGNADHLGKLDLALEAEAVDLLTLVGVVDLDGMNAYYLKGALPAVAAARLVGDPSLVNKSPDEPIETEIWIGADDFLARKVGVRYFQMEPVGGISLSGQTVMTFSDYGKQVDIQAPETA